MRGVVSPSARRFMTRGQTVERLRDAAPDQPTEAEAKRATISNTDCDNAGSCSRLGHGEAFGRFACSASGRVG